MNLLVNVVAFKVGWLSSVVGGANGIPYLGPLVVLVAIVLHLYLVREPRRELALILMTALIGAFWDSVMVSVGWVSYDTGMFAAGLAPYWIIGMWMLFATTLNVAFRRLQPHLVFAAVLGAVSGPLSYIAGEKIGAITFVDKPAALTGLAVAWAIMLPGLLVLARQFDGVQAGNDAAAPQEART